MVPKIVTHYKLTTFLITLFFLFIKGTLVMVPKIVTHYMLMDDLPQPLCGITAVFSAFTFFFHPMVLAMIACIRYLVIVPWTSSSRYVTLPRLKIAFGIIFSFAVIFSILPYLGVGVYKSVSYTHLTLPTILLV